MPQAQEDIYDITDIPYFPYEPGFVAVLVLMLLVVVFALILFYWRKRFHAKLGVSDLYQQLQLELAGLEFQQLDKNRLGFISTVLRRFLSLCEGKDYLNLSPHELKHSAELDTDSKKKTILLLLHELELSRFRPQSKLDPEFVQRLRQAFSDYQLRPEVK